MRILIFLTMFLSLLFSSNVSLSHSGRTNSLGALQNSTGGYHCHMGGFSPEVLAAIETKQNQLINELQENVLREPAPPPEYSHIQGAIGRVSAKASRLLGNEAEPTYDQRYEQQVAQYQSQQRQQRAGKLALVKFLEQQKNKFRQRQLDYIKSVPVQQRQDIINRLCHLGR